MKQIKKRRRILRIGNPIGFSLFCLVCLALLAGLYLGISWAIKNGPGVVKAMRTTVQEEVMTTPTVEPSREPKDELLPTPTPEVKETPALGTPVASTPTPEPTVYVTADPSQDISAPLYGQIIGIDPCRDNTKRPEEAENNLILANHLKRYLESQGAKVVLGRTEEDKGKVEDSTRAKIFREAGCTYVVRLKCNYINAKTSACYVKVQEPEGAPIDGQQAVFFHAGELPGEGAAVHAQEGRHRFPGHGKGEGEAALVLRRVQEEQGDPAPKGALREVADLPV